jgi:hypothetical protein
MGFMDLFGAGQPEVRRKFYGRIDPQRVIEDDFKPAEIKAESSYFQVRMAEMFLRDRNEFLRGFIPLSVVVCKFKYAGEQKEVPFFVGNQLLDSVGAYVKDEPVEFSNTRVVGPVPYMGDDVGLFVGLFRVEVNNLAEKLFGFMEKIISAFDFSKLTSYLKIADLVSDGLTELMGLKQIEMRLGRMDTFAGGSRFKSGYLAFINCDENIIEEGNEPLWVHDGTLMIGSGRDVLRKYSSNDYCLVRVEELSERPDLDSLPFHREWEKTVRSIWEGNGDMAKINYLSLMRKIAVSPDLTPSHRSILMQAYLADYQNENGNYNKFANPFQGADRSVKRGGGGKKALAPRAAIQKTAAVAKHTRLEGAEIKSVERSLKKISSNWDRIPHLEQRSDRSELNSDALNAQIKALGKIQKDTLPDPAALVDTFTFAALNE